MEGSFKRQTMIGVLLFFCALGMMLPTAGQAAGLPAVEQLAGITMNKSALWSPGRLAVGADGTLYVVDSYKNHILKFDRNGNYIGDISFPRVSAVAVAPNGTLYIGSHQDYAVSIVSNGKVVGHLGAGANEFRSIRDIAYDASTGLIYVIDNVGNAVRIYDESGRYANMIEGVNLPIAIEVTAEAIYIIDAPIVKDENSLTTASRVSIFDKNYSLIGTIHDYGKAQMFRPTDIAVSDGILYVTDAVTNSVLLFDEAGALLGEIQSNAGDLQTAVSLAISSNGILYVSSSDTHRIHMFAMTVGISGQQGGQQ
ncbi:MAG: NHL repeat-containing protein [Nitrospirae bacterium]|nr:NHL repeat-containing protein [Nitrospirota bacterium]